MIESKNLFNGITTTAGLAQSNIEPYTLTINGNGFKISDWTKGPKEVLMPEIEQVIFQKEYTIVVWADKKRTIVRCSEEDFDKEKGLAMAIARRLMDRNKFKRLIENAAIQDK